MEPDLQETTRISFPSSGNQVPSTPCCALVFDTRQELLWTGNDAGRITSFHGSELQIYTSYKGHQHEGPVKQILPIDKGIVSISAKSIHLSIRRGLTAWHLNDAQFVSLTCMCLLDKVSQRLVVAGQQSKMFIVNAEIGEVLETPDAPGQYTHMRRNSHFICAATANGRVHLLNPQDFSVQKVFSAHNGSVNDMDANNDFLVTCGWSPRQQYGNMLDPMAKVFDLKNLRPYAPIVFHAGAALVRMHPRMSTTAVIVSQNGQMQLVDITNPNSITMRHMGVMEETRLTGLDISPSGNTLIFSDSMSALLMWGHPSKMNFTDISAPTEFADSTPPEQQIMDWNSNAPFNTIGMPYYREQLLSCWPSNLVFEVGAAPAKLDPALVATLKASTMGGYAPNTKTGYRNQTYNGRSGSRSSELAGPKFLSEQAKDGDTFTIPPRRMSEMLRALEITQSHEGVGHDVPAMYRNVEIKYSKFGVDDFDFEYYNQTEYSGLETHIANAYINPLLQVMRFTTRMRNLALHHTATSCIAPNCILCEIGFLFDMLEKARGQNCQATNFLRVFSSQPETESLRLLEEMSSNPQSTLIQSTNRYLLEWISKDYTRNQSQPDWTLHQTLRTVTVSKIRCANCFHETRKVAEPHVHDLVYGETLIARSHAQLSFSQVLKSSIGRLDGSRGWCSRCGKYQVSYVEKSIPEVPDILTINTAIRDNFAKQLWSRPGWLPPVIGIILSQGRIHCYEGGEVESLLARGFPIKVYQLVGFVAEITCENQKPHLVSIANVSHTKATISNRAPLPDDWYLFNDFLVRSISEEEALHFDFSWKLPMVLTYQNQNFRHAVDDSWVQNLYQDLFLTTYRPGYIEDPTQFLRLDFEIEPLNRNTIVGIDAEFVLLQQAEIEVKADGSTSTLRPGRFGLGRVSVVRGEERSLGSDQDRSSSPSLAGCKANIGLQAPTDELAKPLSRETSAIQNIAFIDDYVAISERIVDYLTKYSGISPGDLDPDYSPHVRTGHLIHLKHAYKKIWILLNLGVTFVGHGLRKDFRTINIHVPKNQVVDTVELFYRRGARQLSLRFLHWLFFSEKVQVGQHGHDSIEDARAALRLYYKYKQFEEEGRVEKMLREVYREGQRSSFRVPETGEASRFGISGRPVTPSLTEGSKPVTPSLTPAVTPQPKHAQPANT